MRRSRIITGLTAVALVLPLGAMTATAGAVPAQLEDEVLAQAPPDDMGGGDESADVTPNVGLGPVLSGDGSTVAFESEAPLLPDDVNTVAWSTCTSDPADPAVPAGTVRGVVDVTDVYRYDLDGKALSDRPSKANTEGLPEGIAPFEATGFRIDGHTGLCVPAGNGADPAISADGSSVAFVSSGNLVGRIVEEEDSHEVTVTAEGSGTTDGTSIEPNVYLNTGPDSTMWVSDDGGSAGRELPAMSADGRYVVLAGRSSAYNGVWVKDTTSDGPATRLASGTLFNPDISPDGNVIAWAKYGTGDSGGQAVYVVQKSPGQSWTEFATDELEPELVSVSDTTGLKADGPTDFPSLSEDGRYVAFQSMDKTLDAEALPGPTGGGPNKAYVYDRQTGDTEMVSVADTDEGDVIVNGNAVKPTITPDGNYVAFASDAGILQGSSEDDSDHATVAAEEDEAESFQQVYLRDRGGQTTTPVSVALEQLDPEVTAFGDGGSATSYGPSISDDGNLVAFESDASNLVADDTNGDTDAFVRDMTTGETTRVSVDVNGEQVDLSPDSAKPQSRARARAYANTSPLAVRYSASDPIFPSLGVAEVQLWVRKPGEDVFTLRQKDKGTAIDGKFAVRTRGVNGLYRFKTVAVDGNGNVEDTPAVADARTRLDTVKPVIRRATVAPAPFDISDDGSTTFTFRVNEKGHRTFLVKRNGIVVKRFAAQLHPRGVVKKSWKGRNDAGRTVVDGRYVVVMRAVDLAGNRSVARVPVRVTR